jgi:hypothetical protein
VAFQLLAYATLVWSISNWQSESIQYQLLLQVFVLFITTVFILRAVSYSWRKLYASVIFSEYGEWLETSIDGQVSWRITDKSRVSSLLLFIHLISPVNAGHSKWYLICKDQVTERDFRRLCRAVIYQQQVVEKR